MEGPICALSDIFFDFGQLQQEFGRTAWGFCDGEAVVSLEVKLRGAGTRNFDVFEHKQAKRGLHKLSDVDMRMVKHTPGTYFISFLYNFILFIFAFT